MQRGISDEDYCFYKKVMETFELKTFGEYYNLYLKLDMLLLADICLSYKTNCLENYKLDPFWFVSAPSLAWQACLKITGQRLELLTDIDMYNMVNAGIRGGMSFMAKKYAEANNKFMSNYNKSKKSTFIDYWDVNNLYGWAMMPPLPIGDFK